MLINIIGRIKNISGQSLLELVVAFGIIVTGVVGALTLTISNSIAASESAERLIAINLAREGIEVIRNTRDTNWLEGEAWDNGLVGDGEATANFNAGSWSLDFNPDSITDSAARLYFHSATGIYNHESTDGAATEYYRLITINPDGTDYMKKVTSLVRWYERGRYHEINLEGWIYNWR